MTTNHDGGGRAPDRSEPIGAAAWDRLASEFQQALVAFANADRNYRDKVAGKADLAAIEEASAAAEAASERLSAAEDALMQAPARNAAGILFKLAHLAASFRESGAQDGPTTARFVDVIIADATRLLSERGTA